MSSKDLPEPWRSRLVEKGYTDGRSPHGDAPSLRALSRAIDVHVTTISGAIAHKRETSPEVVARLAEALGDDVGSWLDMPYHGTWKPPASAGLLNDRQRKAIEELINSMMEREVSGDEQKTSPKTQAGASPAPVTPKKPRRVRKASPGRRSDGDSDEGRQR